MFSEMKVDVVECVGVLVLKQSNILKIITVKL